MERDMQKHSSHQDQALSLLESIVLTVGLGVLALAIVAVLAI
jgi:hypothetical protein